MNEDTERCRNRVLVESLFLSLYQSVSTKVALKQTKYRKIPRGEKSSPVNSTNINTIGTTLSLTGSPSPFGFHSVIFVKKKESLLIKSP